ncbi:MAG: hypothetical protein BGO63_01045 [Candidatus Accumulibacter sp. 66-26]|nr:hypothetical protein [Accumulibacter sp.]OJW50073.1 MAG: hypothetical protein BGO63_01045 [Candidatus Accumulibacter sp. 66-26]
MLNQSAPPRVPSPTPVGPVFPPYATTSRHRPAAAPERAALERMLDDEDAPVEWSEEDIVFLHWRLLKEVSHLEDPATPLEEKFDTLRWVFSEREKDGLPFSFVSCLRVVGCSPLSPIPYCGRVDAEEIRDRIRYSLKAWINASLERYPAWVRDAVVHNPAWVEARLAKNPQWINEQIKRMSVQGDLFA